MDISQIMNQVLSAVPSRPELENYKTAINKRLCDIEKQLAEFENTFKLHRAVMQNNGVIENYVNEGETKQSKNNKKEK